MINIEELKGLVITLSNGEVINVHSPVVVSLLVITALCILSVVIGTKLKNADPKAKPTGLLLLAEVFVTTVINLVESIMGKAVARRYAGYMAMLLLYLGTSNLIGLFGFEPPTTDYNVTLGLALITFVLIHYRAIKDQGMKGYLGRFVEPFALFLPLNIIGEIATPVSMSFRLFGNILSGTLIMTLVYHFLGWFAPLIAPALHGYFDIFAGLIQAFVFTLLTMIFIAQEAVMDEETGENG